MSGTRLERQYRSAVRWYPPDWRRRFGEAMVGVLLDVAEGEQRQAPANGELANLRQRAVAAWLNRIAPQETRSWVASISTGATAAFAAAYFFFVSWPKGFDANMMPATFPTFGPFLNAAPLFLFPIFLMFVAAMAKLRLTAHALGVIAMLGVLVAEITRTSSGNWNGPATTTVIFTILGVGAANLGNPLHRFATAATFVITGSTLTALALLQPSRALPWHQQFVGDAGWWTITLSPALVVAAVIVFISVLFLSGVRLHVIASAIAVAWLPWSAAAAATLQAYAGVTPGAVLLAASSVALALLTLRSARSQRAGRSASSVE